MALKQEARERRGHPEGISRASLQFRIDPERVPWVYAALRNQPQVELFKGPFSEPFTDLFYIARHNQDQMMLVAALGVGSDFNSRYKETVGSLEDLTPFLHRYQRHEFSPDGRQLTVYKDDQVHGVIARIAPDKIIVQQGGQAGQLTLPSDGSNPINPLSIYMDTFNLFLQRYIGTIWKASPETDQKRMQLTIDIPNLPEGAPSTYFSTFEIIAKEFRGRPRPLDLDDDIGGYSDVKATIRGLFLDLTQPDVSRSYGTQPFSNKFVLVTGHEGTGKSLFPKALDAMLRNHFKGKDFEHFRLPFADMLGQYGPYTAVVVKTILDHVWENERKRIPTLVHLDNVEHLVPPHQRLKETNGHLLFSSDNPSYYQPDTTPSDAEFNYYREVLNPIVNALREFGQELGGESHCVIIYGESRVPRENLPEGVTRTFRRSFDLNRPTVADLADILRVQIVTTKKFAQSTERDPFAVQIESELEKMASHAQGLNGRDIQQSLLAIATRKKAEQAKALITPEEICGELDSVRLNRGLLSDKSQNKKIGFQLPYWNE